MQQSTRDYPDLAALLSGWFHQDFDIEGDTVEAVIGAFNKSSTQKARQLIISDISRFLEIGDGQMDEEFIRIFNPDIQPTSFAPTTRAFLEEILLHLSNAKSA